MTEIINIFLQFLIFLLIFSFPFCIYKNKILLLPNSFMIEGIYFKIGINILIHLTSLLFISFLNVQFDRYFYLIIILSILSNIFFLVSKDKINIDFNNIIIFIFFGLITLGFFLKISIDIKLEWDGLNHWFPKTLNFFNEINISGLNNLGHAEYPHLGPFIWAFFWKNSFLQHEYFGRFFYVFFYVTSLFSIIENKFENNNLFKIIILFLLSILTYDLYLFGGYQEYLIFSSLLILSKCFFEIKFKNNNPDKNIFFYFFIITIFHVLIWFKDEGMFYYLFIFISFLHFSELKHRYLLSIICILYVIFQYILQKFLIGSYGFQVNVIHDQLLNNFQPKIFLDKFFLISKYILISSMKYKLWLINFFSLTMLYFFYKEIFLKLKIWFYILLINFIFIYAIYFHTPNDLEFLLKVTLDRVMFQTSGFYLIFTIALLEKIYFEDR